MSLRADRAGSACGDPELSHCPLRTRALPVSHRHPLWTIVPDQPVGALALSIPRTPSAPSANRVLAPFPFCTDIEIDLRAPWSSTTRLTALLLRPHRLCTTPPTDSAPVRVTSPLEAEIFATSWRTPRRRQDRPVPGPDTTATLDRALLVISPTSSPCTAASAPEGREPYHGPRGWYAVITTTSALIDYVRPTSD